MTTPTVGVAMAVRNGLPHLEPQLDSLLRQSLPPTRLVVCDDYSTDGSAAVLTEFVRGAPFEATVISPARQATHDVQSRIAASFESALRACADLDFVAMCDQDDVWFRHRLRSTVGALTDQPASLLAFGDAELIDEAGTRLGERFWDHYPVPTALDRESPRVQFVEHLLHPCVLGAAATLRRDLLGLALPVPPHWLHDRWLGIVASVCGGLLPVHETVMEYRIHRSQAVGLAFEHRRAVVGVPLPRARLSGAAYVAKVRSLRSLRNLPGADPHAVPGLLGLMRRRG